MTTPSAASPPARGRARPEADRWTRLCARLREIRASPGYVTTGVHGVRNHVVAVDERRGFVVLRSERARSAGRERRITRAMVENANRVTTHGVIVRRLRALADETDASPPAPGWYGPFQVKQLLARCLAADQEWPPDDGLCYLVSRHRWTGDVPAAPCVPLYVGSTTGEGGRFVARVGDLVADMHGFYGARHGHSSGGQHVYEWCASRGIQPGELYLSWYVGRGCRRCEEVAWYRRLRPPLNEKIPPACSVHAVVPDASWEQLWGIAGQAPREEIADLARGTSDAALERALRT